MGHRRLVPGSVAALVMALLTGVVSTTPAQDLAALARKERARRATIKKPARVLTEDDARAADPDPPATGAAVTEATPEPTPSMAPPSADAAMAKEEQEKGQWKERAEAVRDAIAQAEARLASMEKDLVTLRSDLTQVSAADAQDPMRLQKRDQKIVESYQAIEIQKGVVADARKALVQLQEDARRKGVPPGWLR